MLGEMPAVHDEPEEPDELTCPICYTIFRDPVHLVGEHRGSGRGVYERDAIISFWRRRPLASFFGGAPLSSAAMLPAVDTRREVGDWLARNPGCTPSGWPSRDVGAPSTQAELDQLSRAIERLAAVRSAAEAIEAAEAARGISGAAAEAALAVLRAQASAVRIGGPSPGRREYTGRYVRCDRLPLVGGRFAFAKEGEPDKMLWYARNGFWHAGRAVDLGRQTGYLIVSDSSGSPEHIMGEWQVELGRGFIPAPQLRCVADEPRAKGQQPALGAQGEGGAAAGPAHGSGSVQTGAAGEEGGEARAGADQMRAGADEELDEWEANGVGARPRAMLVDAARTVCLESGLRTRPLLHGRAWRDFAAPWLGTYERCERRLVNGRYAYAHAQQPGCMLWFAHGFWHLGHAQHLGDQTAAAYVEDSGLCPEAIRGVWYVGTRRGWIPAPELAVRAGEAGAQVPPAPGWGFRPSVSTAIALGALAALGLCVSELIEVGGAWHAVWW